MTQRHRTSTGRWGDEYGQAMGLFAGGLVALLVASGLVLDGGLAFVNRRDAQNAADLAALAGTRAIAEYYISDEGSGTSVYAAIDQTVRANGCTPDGDVPCTWTARYVRPTSGYDYTSVSPSVVTSGGAIPNGAQGVEVTIDRRPPAYFLRVIGQDEWDVGAEATAVTASIQGSGSGILLPVAFDPGRDLVDYDPDDPPTMQFSLGKDGPGNFSWLSWYGPVSAVELGDNVCSPRNPAYDFPVLIEGTVGTKNSREIRDCLDDYINETVYIPLWDACTIDGEEHEGFEGQGANGTYCIVGVAAFLFKGYTVQHGAIDDMHGVLQPYVNYTSIPAAWGGPPCNPAEESCGSLSNYLGLIK
jgi:Flp pilus assembly protein TadG